MNEWFVEGAGALLAQAIHTEIAANTQHGPMFEDNQTKQKD